MTGRCPKLFVDSETKSDIPISPPQIVFSRSRQSARRVTPAAATLFYSQAAGKTPVEKVLPNGDLHSRNLSENGSHRSDSRVFSWPSGASFGGRFKSDGMEGTGTSPGSDGDYSYRGWKSDRKDGNGEKRHSNGDRHEEKWKKSLQDGEGEYRWQNGARYEGEWKEGFMSGKGVLIWENGDQFHGHWKNGAPILGNGVFTWVNGECYTGTWNTDKDVMASMVVGEGKRSSSDGCRKSGPGLPKICIWESDGEAGDITCDIVDNLGASLMCRDSLGFMDFSKGRHRFEDGEDKRPGQIISKYHKNYNFMLNLQLGIRYSVGKQSQDRSGLGRANFDPKQKFWTRFPPEGSRATPPHSSAEFRWKDYCPVVFRHLRELFRIDPADYMLSICGNRGLRELCSPGKSGSLFYLTHDDRFVIKTVKKSDVKVLIRMLPGYYRHVSRYENSLVTKFYGVHCVKPIGGTKTRVVVMGNCLWSEHEIHRRFDLKGSSHGRLTAKQEKETNSYTILKDLDLNFVFHLRQDWFHKLMEQIDRDCEFLEAEKIMDYSLLIGLHFCDNTYDRIGLSPFFLRSGKVDSYQNEKLSHGYRFFEADLQNMDCVFAREKALTRLGANMPARAERRARKSDFDRYSMNGIDQLSRPRGGETYEVVLYFGIIDILQDYDIGKKLEHAYKSLQANPTSISAVDPRLYSKRFRDFIRRIFVEDK